MDVRPPHQLTKRIEHLPDCKCRLFLQKRKKERTGGNLPRCTVACEQDP
jgi:hypothetical protein